MKVKHETPERQDTRDMGRENHGFAYLYRKKSPKMRKHAGRGRDRDREEPPYFFSAEEDRLRDAVGRRHRGAVVAPYHGPHALVVK